jgi:hypothetical protein
MKLFGKKDDKEKYVVEIVNLDDKSEHEEAPKKPTPVLWPAEQLKPKQPEPQPSEPEVADDELVIDEANAEKLGYEQVDNIFDDEEETPLPEPTKFVEPPVKRRGRPTSQEPDSQSNHAVRKTKKVVIKESVPVELPDVEEEEDDDMLGKKENATNVPKPFGAQRIGDKDDMDFMDKGIEEETEEQSQGEAVSVQEATQQFLIKEQQELEQDEQGAYKQQFGQDEYISEDEARARIATMLINRKNLEMMSELNDFEIFKLSIVVSIAQKYNVPLIALFADKLLGFKVSRAREGRREVKDVASPVRKEQDKRSLMDMVMGGNRRM